MYKPGDEVVPTDKSYLCGLYDPKKHKLFYVGPKLNGELVIEWNGNGLYIVNPEDIMPKPKLKKVWFNVYMRRNADDVYDREFFLSDPYVSEKGAIAFKLKTYVGNDYFKTISMMVPE
jgi:hypothetical protein